MVRPELHGSTMMMPPALLRRPQFGCVRAVITAPEDRDEVIDRRSANCAARSQHEMPPCPPERRRSSSFLGRVDRVHPQRDVAVDSFNPVAAVLRRAGAAVWAAGHPRLRERYRLAPKSVVPRRARATT